MSTLPRSLPTAHLDSASQPYVRELGRMVIAGSRLESLTRAIAERLDVDSDSVPIDAVLEQISTRVGHRKPPLDPSIADEVTAWVSGARLLLDTRARLFEAAASGRFAGVSADSIQLVTPDGTRVAADAEYLERMIQRIHRHDVGGHLLYVALEAPTLAEDSSNPIALHAEARPLSATSSERTTGVV